MVAQLIHELLDDAGAHVPGATAVSDADGSVTYRSLVRLSHAVARWLHEAGVVPGERLMVQLPSDRRLVALFYGASRAGVVFLPVNPAMKEFHLRSVLADSEPALVVTAGDAVPRLGALATVPVWDIDDVWAEVLDLAAGDAPAPDVPVRPDDIAVLIYTSGSTASPKAVIGPHAQVVFACRAIHAVLAYQPDDVVFCRFPLSWDYGLYKVLLTALGRCHIVLANAEQDMQLIHRMVQTGTTIVPIVPSFASMILTLARRHHTLPPVRLFTNTGAALPKQTTESLRALFPGARVVRQFGQTECKRISIMPPAEETERPGSVGLPLPGTRVLLLDQSGDEVPVGSVGEIVVTGPHVMPGYWRAPELSARTFRPDPAGGMRLHTGDYGSVDADGYLYFEGRRDDMFKRKGIRMSTLEIEAAAMDIDGVTAAAALPPSDGRDLAIVVAGAGLHPRIVLKELAQRLELLKVPSVCRVVDAIPLTQYGKPHREALAAIAAAER